MDGTFLGYKQEFDLLSYMDQEVPGCSFPQFYFKVRGVWTGGHQENINMCSVNINHGPDASEWYSMEFKYVEEFRAQLKKGNFFSIQNTKWICTAAKDSGMKK